MASKALMVVDFLPVDLVLSWRWRCQSKGTAIPGSELCLVGFPTIFRGSEFGMFRLSEYGSHNVDRDNLRCACGAGVIPLAALEARLSGAPFIA